jgi:RHS repeat-associated protein
MQVINEKISYIANGFHSSLGDFGVRKYDNEIDRFTSIDTLWEKYYSWTPYHYCSNNPVMGSDGSGLWDEKGHNKILEASGFGPLATEVLEQASLDADKDQSLKYSYKHAMKVPWQSVEQAEILYNDFLEGQIQKFATTENYGEALYQLGLGLHAKMDAWAPTHNGFQTWNGIEGNKYLGIEGYIVTTGLNVFKGMVHLGGEVVCTDEKAKEVANDIKKYFDRAVEARNKYSEEKDEKK